VLERKLEHEAEQREGAEARGGLEALRLRAGVSERVFALLIEYCGRSASLRELHSWRVEGHGV